jgi:hypothetical protein
VGSIDVDKLRRHAAWMNHDEAEWLASTIRYALESGADADVDALIARGSRDWRVDSDRARAFARRLTREELEWFAENAGELHAEVAREYKSRRRRQRRQ